MTTLAAWTPEQVSTVINTLFQDLIALVGAVAGAVGIFLAARAKYQGDSQAPQLTDALETAYKALDTSTTNAALLEAHAKRLQSHDARITAVGSDVVNSLSSAVSSAGTQSTSSPSVEPERREDLSPPPPRPTAPPKPAAPAPAASFQPPRIRVKGDQP